MLYNKRKNKSEITKEMAEKILRSINFKFNKINSIGISYTNDVFLVEDKEKKFVLKFFTDQWVDNNFGKREYNTLLLLKKMGLPVPNVLLFKESDDVSPRNYMIMEKLDGTQMCTEMDNVSSKTIDECISFLKRFQEISGQFGFFDHDENVHKTYDNHFNFINDSVYYAIKKVKDLGYNNHNLQELFSKQRYYDTDKKVLTFTHGDFSPKHIFIKGERVTGLIDFEWSIFSEPINDAILFLTSISEYNVQKSHLVKIMNYCNSIANPSKVAYYAARAFILKAAWPHKTVKQPYYSQTCLDKAKRILDRGSLEIGDLLQSEYLGVVGE